MNFMLKLLDFQSIRIKIRKYLYKYFENPVATFLFKIGVTANMVTIAGLLISFAAAALVANGFLIVGGAIFFVGSIFDLIDGALARKSLNPASKRGAFLDSMVDRISEGVILIALLINYSFVNTEEDLRLVAILIGVSIFSSMLFSYSRAKGESLGVSTRSGLFTRAERVILISLMLLSGNPVLWGLWVLAVGATLSSLTRSVTVYLAFRKKS